MLSIFKKGIQYWLGYYLYRKLSSYISRTRYYFPAHIIFCFVDHYEPFHGGVDDECAKKRVQEWVNGYPQMADKHRDADGKTPRHTWFYPPHLDHRFLNDLVKLCLRGYGDIEMHLHHNHMEPFPDTSETLKEKIRKCIEDYSKYGIFCLPNGEKKFGFIHGDWALDNSRGDEFCGVNDEIKILSEMGCYADFTFPTMGKAQPKMVNTFYYAKDNPEEPKSYNSGVPVHVGGNSWGDLMMIQGIMGFRWKSRTHRFKPSIEAANIDKADNPFSSRIDFWVKNGITVEGKPDWVFIKLHTHGGRNVDFDYLFGEYADTMHTYLEQNYNDNKKYFLHYVTAREMYNIIKAAEAGESGNPDKYRDYVIPKYIYKQN